MTIVRGVWYETSTGMYIYISASYIRECDKYPDWSMERSDEWTWGGAGLFL